MYVSGGIGCAISQVTWILLCIFVVLWQTQTRIQQIAWWLWWSTLFPHISTSWSYIYQNLLQDSILYRFFSSNNCDICKKSCGMWCRNKDKSSIDVHIRYPLPTCLHYCCLCFHSLDWKRGLEECWREWGEAKADTALGKGVAFGMPTPTLGQPCWGASATWSPSTAAEYKASNHWGRQSVITGPSLTMACLP